MILQEARLSALLAHLRSIQTVTVQGTYSLKIGRKAYPAVRYEQTRYAPPTNAPYTIEGLYVLGELPPSYLHNPGGMYTHGLRYTMFGARWYVAGHSSDASREAHKPFFLLFRDDAKLPCGNTMHVQTTDIAEPAALPA